jgi:cellulose synthase/poly-beta-1,6-N-acetylglucosamine synthase-like glycosyltransferase
LFQFVIPAYGESPFLEACIQSLKNQTVDVDILLATSTPNLYIQQLADKYKIPVLVNSQGEIELPFIGKFAVANKGREEVENEIEKMSTYNINNILLCYGFDKAFKYYIDNNYAPHTATPLSDINKVHSITKTLVYYLIISSFEVK